MNKNTDNEAEDSSSLAMPSLGIGGGVAALAALFAVRKYLLVCPGCMIVASNADAENIKG